jgi:glycosyltransferase involved in cell wall biosynthesis
MNEQRNQYFVDVAPVNAEDAVYRYLGLVRNDSRSLQDFSRSVGKAVTSNSSHILLAPNFFEWPHWSPALSLLGNTRLKVRFLLDESHARRLSPEHASVIASARFEVVLLIHQSSCHPSLGQLACGEIDVDEYLLVVTRGFPAISVVHQLPLHKVRFYFPIPHEFNLDLLLPPETHDLILRLRTRFPSFDVRPPEGLDIFDPRIPADFELEPTLAPVYAHNENRACPEISIIIPAYNSRGKLINVLKHLSRQTIGFERYEILVVDDGSDDGTGDVLREWLDVQNPAFELTYFHFGRNHPRCMGDDKFRAGIARNIGAKHARGEVFLFLDSDILLSPTYLDELLRLHCEYDVVQGRRAELRPALISDSLNYEQVRLGADTFYEGGKYGYWDSFYSSAQAWNEMPAGWKYCCTHSLSIRTPTFADAKPFRRTFVHYGFEDTDMGFRLWSAGAKMTLHGQQVLHLHDTGKHSEYSGSHRVKLMLLAETAPSFYYNTLHDDVFRKLDYLFRWFHDSRYFIFPILGIFARFGKSEKRLFRSDSARASAKMRFGTRDRSRNRQFKRGWSYSIYLYKVYKFFAKRPARLIAALVRGHR